MALSAVVERFDVVEEIRLRLGPRTVVPAMHALILEVVQEALRGRVVPSVALATLQARASGRRKRLAPLGKLHCRGTKFPRQRIDILAPQQPQHRLGLPADKKTSPSRPVSSTRVPLSHTGMLPPRGVEGNRGV